MDLKTGILLPSLLIGNMLSAQFGTFDAKRVTAAKSMPTNVVLDNGNSQYNTAIMDAVKANWEFGSYEFIKQGDLGPSGYLPETLYLIKIEKTAEQTHTSTYLTLMEGWKMKKGQAVETKGNSVTNVPEEQELAFIQIAPEAMEENNTAALTTVYVKHLLDYLGKVAGGKITDKTTAERTYSSRTRLVRDGKLLLGDDQLDNTVAGTEAAAEFYTNELQLVANSALIDAIKAQDKGSYIGDIIITGEYKTKYCFKRIFNAGTGELVFMSETPALHGKKEGFLDEDLKDLARAR